MAKTKAQLQAELDELKERLRVLTEAQAAEAAAREPEAEITPEPATVVDAEEVEDEGGGIDFDELVDLLKREIDDVPVMTCLAIFGLGLITGKLLSH